jgi:hypothetical protein
VDPRPGNDAGSLLCDLVVHGASPGMLGCSDLGNANPSLGSSGIGGPGITGLLLSGPHGSSSPSIIWSQVEDNAEYACS